LKRKLLAAFIAVAAASLVAPSSALADPPQILVDSATLSIENIMDGAQGRAAESYLRRAKAVVVCPDIFRAGLVFGGEGGACVLSARAADGAWSFPAFYNLGGGSFGAQIGVQNSQVMMLVMTSSGLNNLLNSQVKFGGEASGAAGTLSTGVAGGMSTDLNTDIVVFSKSQGLYGGATVSGSSLSNDVNAQQAYYGTALSARQIVIDMQGSNNGANPLRSTLARYGG
jgi:lipid-binding SYLF domain-containing protein